MRNVCELVRQSSSLVPDNLALVSGADRVTYRELWAHICRVAAGLNARGISGGSRVAIFLDKRTETVASMFGATAGGCVFIPISPQLKTDQIIHILAESEARVLITTRIKVAMLRARLADCPSLELIVALDGPGDDTNADGRTMTNWASFVDCEVSTEFAGAPGLLDEDMAAILYTSGSTGKPKGVVLSHRNLLEGARSVASYLDMTEADRVLCVLPLNFDAGLSQLTTSFLQGAAAILVNYLIPQDAVDVAAREDVTCITGVPSLWFQLAQATWPDDNRRRLRLFANTGGQMPAGLLASLRALFPNARPFLMYGLTEAFRSTYLDPDEVDRQPGSIGKAIPNARIKVIRPDGSECSPYEHGELVHIGAHVAMGYWRRPEETQKRFRPAPGAGADGLCQQTAVWSGDIVYRNEEGFLFFVGRLDGMIKTSGYRVSSTEIEETLLASELIGEAVVVGIPNPELGQEILAYVTAGASGTVDEAALRKYAQARLPLYMIPRRFVLLDAMPRNNNEKYDRVLLSKLALNAETPGQLSVLTA